MIQKFPGTPAKINELFNKQNIYNTYKKVLLWSVHKLVGLVSKKVSFQLKFFAMNMGGHDIPYLEYWH